MKIQLEIDFTEEAAKQRGYKSFKDFLETQLNKQEEIQNVNNR